MSDLPFFDSILSQDDFSYAIYSYLIQLRAFPILCSFHAIICHIAVEVGQIIHIGEQHYQNFIIINREEDNVNAMSNYSRGDSSQQRQSDNTPDGNDT